MSGPATDNTLWRELVKAGGDLIAPIKGLQNFTTSEKNLD